MPLSVRSRTAVGIPVAALAAVLLPVTAHAEPAPPAAGAAPVPKAPASAAATWMASKLTDGTHAKGDQGLTADVVMGLASADTGGAVQKKATDWLEANAGAYIESKGGPGTVFAGGLAKLTLVAAVEHRDPKDFGGRDLVKTLTESMQENGRFTDKNPTGDGSQQFTQSLAVLALQRTGGAPVKAVDFIARSRCPDGGFPLGLGAAPDACKSHMDSTGLAVQALLGSGRTAAVQPALDWLVKHQLPDGGFPDNSMGSGAKANSNSTALAVQALAAGGRTEAAAKGVAWLRSRQVNCSAPAKDRGAVGFLEPKADGMALRATAQVVPALAGRSLAQVDAADSAPDLERITCVPGGGTPGGDDGGTSGGNGDDGGTDGGGNGGDDGGTGGTGGTGGGDNGGGDTGSDGGTGSGGGDTTTGGPDDDATGGGGNTPAPQTGGTSGGSGDIGGSGIQPVGNPGGSLASTGTATLPMTVTAGGLLAVGATAVLVARRRRATP
ncbi:prenyltransferase/squalene oxidase repeat-containing protein [Streptomyces sp. NPDC047071]|uniref:prenyltransferase/squalene oxidase repeat-containing protein n=1 Tax=Streptomyces sp. NPDC047071 TaxID=3154808 RepID=UPI00345319A7